MAITDDTNSVVCLGYRLYVGYHRARESVRPPDFFVLANETKFCDVTTISEISESYNSNHRAVNT